MVLVNLILIYPWAYEGAMKNFKGSLLPSVDIKNKSTTIHASFSAISTGNNCKSFALS